MYSADVIRTTFISRMICWWLCLLFIAQGTYGLRLARLDVPAAVIFGEPAWLNCSYDLEKDELYSVKWYKNNVEFYRYLPNDDHSGQKYELPGVFVNLTASELGHVLLYKTDLSTDGTYRCEVSAESPSFQTVREEKEIRVYVLPKDGPNITGIRPQYQVGDEVNVTCRAGPSKPAAALRWYINGKEAPPEFEVRSSAMRIDKKLSISTLRLRFVAEPRHFWHGAMKLRCSAVISQAYSMSSEEIIVGDHVRASPVIGDGPVISGGLDKYKMGDLVNVNCTSAKSKPPAELHWYINDRLIRQEELLYRYPIIWHPDSQGTRVLGLRFTAKKHNFHYDEMRLKCTATLSKVINMSSEEEVIGSSQRSSELQASEGAMINRGSKIGCLLQTFVVSTVLFALL